MRKLVIKNFEEFSDPNSALEDYEERDCKRLIGIFKEKDLEISLEEAYALWRERSDSWAAGWLFMSDNDEDVYLDICDFCETDLPPTLKDRYE